VTALLTVSGPVGTGTAQLTFDAPALTHSRLPNWPSSGGASVTLLGVNFGMADATVTGSLASLGACSTSAWTSATALQCQAQASASFGAMQAFVISVGGMLGTRTLAMSFDAPAVTHALGSNIARSGGGGVTFLGVSFGSADLTATSSIASAGACATSTWTTATALQCLAAFTYTGGSAQQALTVGGAVGTRTSGLTFDAPDVTQLV
jgi:hypothetical protein